ncbi:MAGUK p55 subfamily member 7 [Diaphorina citri]|uniref:MAGUK p55 subfamily member 7 n=1 Tax=Diaphorina citri TaxID=121845 RepID=A0A3Q0ISE9_DIACI|nr:MAGUK p55 subfamily member 7 [Diaphorina citri]
MTALMTSNEKEEFDISVSSLLETLQESQSTFSANDEELLFLSSLLQSKELNALVHVHNSIVNEQSHPVLSNAMQISLEVLDVLLSRLALNDDCKELFVLLQRPNLQGLLCAHDAVAQKDYYPRLPEIPQELVDDEEETVKIVQLVKSNEPLVRNKYYSTLPEIPQELVDDEEETVKIVQLVKSNEPLGEGNENLPVGATIKTDEESGKIVVARVMHGGAADRSGLIHVGDEVCEVNGINVEGKTPGDVLKILQSSEGTITFKLIPADNKLGYRESKIRVRAHFDYDASSDPYIPCKDAGLSFNKGDILHVVSQDDAYWYTQTTTKRIFARSPFDQYNSRAFTDDEFHDIIRVAKRIQFLYHHWFDEVIVNEDLGVAFEQLLRAVERVETEPSWVPASWVQ